MTEDLSEWIDELKSHAELAAEIFGWNGKTFPPGKMEGNPFYVAYMWNQLQIGGDFETVGVWECTMLQDYEKEHFELEDTWAICLREDDSGFVHYKLVTEKEYDELQAEAQFDREHP